MDFAAPTLGGAVKAVLWPPLYMWTSCVVRMEYQYHCSKKITARLMSTTPFFENYAIF